MAVVISDREKQNKNLIPINDRPPDEARAIRSRGGIASGEKKRKKKAMKEAVEAVLSLKAPAKMKAELKKMGFKNEDCINQTIMVMQVFQAACKGDIRAAEFMRDTGGEAPGQQQNEENGSVQIIDDL